MEVITEIQAFYKYSVWEIQPLSFCNISKNLQKNRQKKIFLAYFGALKAYHKLFLQPLTLHCSFLTLVTVFQMYNTIYPYLFLLFSHCVFIFTFLFLLVSLRNTFCNIQCFTQFHCKLPITLRRSKILHSPQKTLYIYIHIYIYIYKYKYQKTTL